MLEDASIEAQVAEVAAVLAETAAQRDRAGGTAWDERRLLRNSGLLTLSVPKEYGGREAAWPVILKAVRRLAEADSSIAHLFGFQHLQVATVLLFGSRAQQQHYLGKTVSQGWFWGNAVNARDPRLAARRVEGGWQLDGVKSYCSGAQGSDVLNVSVITGPLPADRKYFVVPTGRTGITVRNDWDNMGQRQTDSGSVAFEAVQVHDSEQLGPPGPASSPRATLRAVIAQAILIEIYLGNAFGAFAEATRYLRTHVQPWAMAGVERAVDDPMLQLRAGEQWSALIAARALADEAARTLQHAWSRGLDLTDDERATASLAVGAARIAAARAALDTTERIFEFTGARGTAAGLALDRYWRNVRVHTLHDPLDYRAKELGRWLLAGEPPHPHNYG